MNLKRRDQNDQLANSRQMNKAEEEGKEGIPFAQQQSVESDKQNKYMRNGIQFVQCVCAQRQGVVEIRFD